MRMTIPLMKSKLSLHFGRCDEFTVFEVVEEKK